MMRGTMTAEEEKGTVPTMPDRYGSSGKGSQGRKYNGDPVPVRYEKDQ